MLFVQACKGGANNGTVVTDVTDVTDVFIFNTYP